MTTVKPADAAVVLSMGNRPTELAKALRTLGTQEGIDLGGQKVATSAPARLGES